MNDKLICLVSQLINTSLFFSVACNSETKLLTGSHGSLSSPDRGQSGICTWSIVVPTDLRIIFYFKFYNIEYCSTRSTCSDCTRIELKDDQNEPSWETFCDSKSEIPEPISTNKSTLYVNFVQAKDDSDSWFTAEYVTWPFEGSMNGMLLL